MQLERTISTSRQAADRSGSRSGRAVPALLRVNLPSLRRALRHRPEVLEAFEAGERKATGRPGVNVATIWQLTTRSLYASADVPVLGTRETAQNGVDAIRAAIKARQIGKSDGVFSVTWDPAERSLTWKDNGIGMSVDDITERFLVLGSSGKSAAADSDEAAGGFGVAKAVILGTASKFRWRLHTRDNLAVSNGLDGDVEIFEAPHLRGTEITAFDVSTDYDYWWDSAGGGTQPLEARLLELLAANDLPEITLQYNGKEVRPRFNRRGGSKIEVIGTWGAGTTARVKAYKRADRRGAYWVRLNGLMQFKAGSRGDLGVDVVIDLTTTVRPGELGYPLNAGRDSLQGAARHAFQTLVQEVERENLAVGKQQEDEVFEPEGELDEGLADDVQALTQEMLNDPLLAGVLEQAGIGPATPHNATDTNGDAEGQSGAVDQNVDTVSPSLFSIFRSEGRSGAVDQNVDSIAGVQPTADGFGSPDNYSLSPDGEGATARAPQGPVLQTNLPDDHRFDLHEFGGQLPWLPAGLRKVEAIRTALERAEAESPFELSSGVIEVLKRVQTDLEVTVAELRLIAKTLDAAARMVAFTRGLDQPRIQTETRKTSKASGNPFGRLGALRISRSDYDRKRARAFKRNPKKWIGALLLWDTTLKLMASAGEIRRAIRPGFVLENGLVGLAERGRNASAVTVYLNPDRLMEVVNDNKERPLAIAGFLHSVASHELCHADGRMGDGHSQSFVSAREDLGIRTAHLLPQLAALAVKLLKLPEPRDESARKAEQLGKQLEKAKAARDRLRKELRTARSQQGRKSNEVEVLLGQLDAAEDRIQNLKADLEGCVAIRDAFGEELEKVDIEMKQTSCAVEREVERRCPHCSPGTLAAPPTVVIPPAPTSDTDKPTLGTPIGVGTHRPQTDLALEPAARYPAPRVLSILSAARGALRRNPPPGISVRELDDFFGRHHARFVELLETRLGLERVPAITETLPAWTNRQTSLPRLHEAMTAFRSAAAGLNSAWDQSDQDDLPPAMLDKYPFHLSFDELLLAIFDWYDAVFGDPPDHHCVGDGCGTPPLPDALRTFQRATSELHHAWAGLTWNDIPTAFREHYPFRDSLAELDGTVSAWCAAVVRTLDRWCRHYRPTASRSGRRS